MADKERKNALQGFGGNAGLNTIEGTIRYEDQDNYNSRNGVLSHNGIERHTVAIGPALQNPNFTLNENGGLKGTEMIYGTCVDITIEFEGNIFQIIEFQHVKPGKGAAFVRTKLKNVKNGGVIEKTFRPTEKCPQARIDRKDMQYLYSDGDLYHFMDVENYEQIALNEEAIGDTLKFVKENEMVKVCSHNGNVFAIEPPLFVELEITETEPGFKGDTATGATKPAVVETGATVYVPLFVNQGDVIKIDTRTGEYLSRV